MQYLLSKKIAPCIPIAKARGFTALLITRASEWFSSLPLIQTESRFLVTHAGMDRNRHILDQPDQELIWNRDMGKIPAANRMFREVIHGHTPVPSVVIRKDRINVDTGCVFRNKLSAVRVDTLPDKVYTFSIPYEG